jgi:predicted phosphohydrolase
MATYNHDTDCIATRNINGARVWMSSDERTIIVETWDRNREMTQVVMLPGDIGYSLHAERLFN